MAVSFIAAGAIASATNTTLTIAAPAGLTGDLLVFILMNDDASDTPLAFTTTVAPVAVTVLSNIGAVGTPSGAAGQMDDSKMLAWWCVHDQDAGENWTFGTATSTPMKGVCLRFRGQHATPIVAGSPVYSVMRSLLFFPPTTALEWGSMFVGVRFDDAAPGAQDPPTGWVEQVDSSATNVSLYVATREAINYPFPYSFPRTLALAGDEMSSFSFCIAPAAATTYTVSGVTYDKVGAILVSCEVSLFRERTTGVYEYVGTTTSNGTTGAYSFTVPENASNFMVVARKDGAPNVFDVTENNLTPV